MALTASTPVADLSADEHAQSKVIAYLKSLVRGGGAEPPYHYEHANGDFWQAAGEVLFQRPYDPAAGARRTMSNPDVKHLYLYRPPNEYTTKILESMRLWASKPGAFNDPFDCDLDVAKGVTEADVIHAVTSLHGQRAEWPSQISQYVDSIMDGNGQFTPAERDRIAREIDLLIANNKNSGVICLSEVNDSILMWSHYACNHNGICIEFEGTPYNTLGDPELATAIKYSPVYPDIDLGKMLVHRDGQTLDLMLRYKADCWSYEKEWRVFTDRGSMSSRLVGRITKVIFGLRTPIQYRQVIQTWCDARRIRAVQAAKANREFKLVIPS
jgi:hypothetical protein